MVNIFKPLRINVLDHIIVGGTDYISLAQNSNIPEISMNLASYEPISLGKTNAVSEHLSEHEIDEELELEC